MVLIVIVQARLDAQLTVNGDEMRQRQTAIARELEKIVKRQQQLEATNERLQEKAVDIRRSLTDNDLSVTDAQYQQLRLINEDDITLKDFVAVRTVHCSPNTDSFYSFQDYEWYI